MNIKILSIGGETMRIRNLKISNVAGIKELSLDFNDGFNVICGPNGIGKTTILNVIGDAFAGGRTNLKRNARSSEGEYSIKFESNNISGVNTKKVSIEKMRPDEEGNIRASSKEVKKILTFNINRSLDYFKLNAIPRDIDRNEYDSGLVAQKGIDIRDAKGWFINRYAFYDKDRSLTEEQKDNFKIAKKAFGLLDSNVKFDTVDSGTLDIMLDDNGNTIYFEYLSAGYKTCIYIVLGIIKEIEYRFKSPCIRAEDFDGTILIDEIDLHLHPTWQAKLIYALKNMFPKAQFIVTTHSPSILQSLEKNEIIALRENEDGRLEKTELQLGEYGLQGWTLEEILKDVMGMPSTTSELFQKTIDAFDKAMNDENVTEIKKYYGILDKMLHPNSTLRKLLQIQMAGMEE